MSTTQEKLAELKKKQAEGAARHLAEVQAGAKESGILPDLTAEGIKTKPVIDTTVSTVVQESVEALSKIRIFRSRVANSRFIFSTGKEIFFTEGWYETSDSDEIRQLDEVANKVPTIYTDEHEKEIIAAIVEARRQGFTGTVAAMMTEQLSLEQRIAAIRHQGNAAVLNLTGQKSPVPSLLPPVDISGPSVDTEASLRAAIARAKSMKSESNG